MDMNLNVNDVTQTPSLKCLYCAKYVLFEARGQEGCQAEIMPISTISSICLRIWFPLLVLTGIDHCWKYVFPESIAKGSSVRSPWTSYTEPSCTEPSCTEPSYIEPSYIEPSYIEPSYIEPSYIEPSYIEPSYIEPSYIEPSYIEQVAQSQVT